MSKCPGKCYHMMNVFAGKQEDVDIWIRACKEEVSLHKEMINNPFLHISLDPSWRVEKVLLRSKLCLRSWFPLCSALQTAHEGISRCKGYHFHTFAFTHLPLNFHTFTFTPLSYLLQVVLSVRDPKTWYTSVFTSIYQIGLTLDQILRDQFDKYPLDILSIALGKAPDCKVACWTGVVQKNDFKKIWTKVTHALSRLTEGDQALKTWLTRWTLNPSKAAKPL